MSGKRNQKRNQKRKPEAEFKSEMSGLHLLADQAVAQKRLKLTAPAKHDFTIRKLNPEPKSIDDITKLETVKHILIENRKFLNEVSHHLGMMGMFGPVQQLQIASHNLTGAAYVLDSLDISKAAKKENIPL